MLLARLALAANKLWLVGVSAPLPLLAGFRGLAASPWPLLLLVLPVLPLVGCSCPAAAPWVLLLPTEAVARWRLMPVEPDDD